MFEQDDGIKISDMENFSGGSPQEFSHSSLVMMALSRASKYLGREMREGYFNEKQDHNGNITKVYVDDTRLSFIESVKAVEIMMSCDFDDEAETNINALKEKTKGLKDKYLLLQAEEWNKTPRSVREMRISQGINIRSRILNPKLPFLNEYILEEVQIYQEILRELVKLSKRKNFYSEIGEDY